MKLRIEKKQIWILIGCILIIVAGSLLYLISGSSVVAAASNNAGESENISVVVTFNASGGSPVTTKNVEVGSAYGTLGVPTRSGFTFDGWYTASTGGTQVTSETIVTANADHTLYARWIQLGNNSIVVTFESNGGSDVTTKNVTAGSAYGTLGTPTKNGYVFNGWYDKTGTQVTSQTVVSNGKNHILYAMWAVSGNYSVVVTLESNGGSDVTAKNVAVGSAYGSLGTPTKSGHVFNGWYDETGTQVTSKTIVSNSNNHILYAMWAVAPKVVVVKFNASGGTPVTAKNVEVGSPYGTLGTPARAGFTFDGWYTASTGGTQVTSETIVTANADHTLYARWK